MKPILLLLIGIALLSFCSDDKKDLESIEFISYTYIWKSNANLELRCYRYAFLKGDGSVLYYNWKKYHTNRPEYCKTFVVKEFFDSLMYAEENQMRENLKEQELIKQGYQSLYDGPYMKIKINLSNGTHKVTYFRMGDPLSKYLGSIGKEENLVPINDTIDLINKKSRFIKFISIEDSINPLGVAPFPKN
jgi:hypothetical protein